MNLEEFKNRHHAFRRQGSRSTYILLIVGVGYVGGIAISYPYLNRFYQNHFDKNAGEYLGMTLLVIGVGLVMLSLCLYRKSGVNCPHCKKDLFANAASPIMFAVASGRCWYCGMSLFEDHSRVENPESPDFEVERSRLQAEIKRYRRFSSYLDNLWGLAYLLLYLDLQGLIYLIFPSIHQAYLFVSGVLIIMILMILPLVFWCKLIVRPRIKKSAPHCPHCQESVLGTVPEKIAMVTGHCSHCGKYLFSGKDPLANTKSNDSKENDSRSFPIEIENAFKEVQKKTLMSMGVYCGLAVLFSTFVGWILQQGRFMSEKYILGVCIGVAGFFILFPFFTKIIFASKNKRFDCSRCGKSLFHTPARQIAIVTGNCPFCGEAVFIHRDTINSRTPAFHTEI